MKVQISWPVIIAILIPNSGSWIIGYISMWNNLEWYKLLITPSWLSSPWAFGSVWLIVYCSMGYASHLVLRECGSWKKAALPLFIYGVNVALNWAWTPIFFAMHELKWATYEIMTLWNLTIALAAVFYRINNTAGLLIIPFTLLTTFTAIVTYIVYRQNEETV